MGPATGDAEQLMMLLAQTRGGDHEAMARIVETRTQMVQRSGARHAANATDVVQEVWLAMAQDLRWNSTP